MCERKTSYLKTEKSYAFRIMWCMFIWPLSLVHVQVLWISANDIQPKPLRLNNAPCSFKYTHNGYDTDCKYHNWWCTKIWNVRSMGFLLWGGDQMWQISLICWLFSHVKLTKKKEKWNSVVTNDLCASVQKRGQHWKTL